MDRATPTKTAAPPPSSHPHVGVPATRAGRAWIALAAAFAALVVVLVFILENLRSVRVSFFGASWRIPLAIDLLLASLLGAVIVLLLGSVRILQLRRVARHRVPRERAPEGAGEVAPTAQVVSSTG